MQAVAYSLKKSKSNGNWSDKLLEFFIYEDIGEILEKGLKEEYSAAILTIFLGKLRKGKKGYKLVKKLFKFGKGRRLPTPDLDPNQFVSKGGKMVHTKTGAIYSKSTTSHGNVGNTGTQWKIWPKNSTDFGKSSKKAGSIITIDSNGQVIGH